MQRTGTTSVGQFFRDFDFRWAGWPADKKNGWTDDWFEGDFEKIFSSQEFRLANAYEDSPWWMPGFYKILYHRFPNARFILFTRDADKWFQSMVSHSDGNVIGRGKIHCKIYRREEEYFDLLRSGAIDEAIENQLDSSSQKKMKILEHAEQYKQIYRLHALEVEEFFQRHAPHALHIGKLDDPEKWQRLGEFLGVNVPAQYESHENAKTPLSEQLADQTLWSR